MDSEPIDRLRVELLRLAPSWGADGDLTERLYALMGLFVANTPDFMMLVSPDGTILYVNRVRPGAAMADVIGRNLVDYSLPGLRAEMRAALGRVVTTGQAESGEMSATYSDSAAHTFVTRFAPILEHGSAVAVAVIASDITASRAAETALRESDEKLRLTVAATGMGLWEWDIKRNVVKWDDAMHVVWGVTKETVPHDYLTYMARIHPDDRESVAAMISKTLETGDYPGVEHRIVRPDGTIRSLMAKGTVTRAADGSFAKIIGGCLDVTDRRENEERQRQSQRLEAVGQLSAGIAHNFNNLLMAILPNLELAMIGATADTRELLESARDASHRAAELVRQLMTLAGRQQPGPRRTEDIRLVVERTLDICRRAFDRRIAITVVYPDEPTIVSHDATQLEQALLNILINARDALMEANIDVPTVQIEVSRISGSAKEIRDQRLAWLGDGVCVRIGDNGPGMSESVRRHIYEPFFTTKDVGKGTGLGLATTLTIVKEHGGGIDCVSGLGRGTSFAIYLPSGDAPTSKVLGAEPSMTPDETTKAILVVDDEDAVRHSVTRMLERAGYKVHAAKGGLEALELLSDSAILREVTLVLLDVSMPGMPGTAVRREIRAIAPHLPVAYFTGYALDPPKTPTASSKSPSATRI